MFRVTCGLLLVTIFFGVPGLSKTSSQRNRAPAHDQPADQGTPTSPTSFGPDLFRNFFSNKLAPHGGAAYNFLSGAHPVAPYFVPVPIVVPPPPPPPPGPKCYTNRSDHTASFLGYLCCNVTLENTMFAAYEKYKRSPKYSSCNVHKMATVVQDATQDRFNHSFETIVGHKDFVAKSRFSGDLNCKVEIDGKFFLAYATPSQVVEPEVNIIDGNSFFGFAPQDTQKTAAFEKQFAQNKNLNISGGIVSGTSAGKPTYLLYGPLR
uniref:Ground-like domain-containing protein n=1 Tax=Steinernema glaseri TaxID=37863 RepID=A0A1I7Z6J9_9BILA